jgi:hypothetical protein
MNFKEFLVSKSVSDITTLDAEAQAGLYNEYNEASKTAIEEAVAAKASKEDVDALKSELESNMTKQFVALQTVLKEQGVYMKKLSKEEAKESNKGISELLGEKADALKALAKGSSRENVRIEVSKAVGDMALSTNTTGQIPQADRNPIIGDVKERMTTLLDIVTIGSIGSNVKEWVYVTGEEGAAGSTAEGAIKNQIDFDLVVGSNKVEKVTAYITAN